MIEKAETSLGIPSPTELSAQVEEEQQQQGKILYCVPCKIQTTWWWLCRTSRFLIVCKTFTTKQCKVSFEQVRPAVKRMKQWETDRQRWEVQ